MNQQTKVQPLSKEEREKILPLIGHEAYVDYRENLLSALATIDQMEKERDEFKRAFIKADGDCLNLLWDDDREEIYTAGGEGPGLVAKHFRDQRDVLKQCQQKLADALVILRKSHFVSAGIPDEAACKRHAEHWGCEVCKMLDVYHAQKIGEQEKAG